MGGAGVAFRALLEVDFVRLAVLNCLEALGLLKALAAGVLGASFDSDGHWC